MTDSTIRVHAELIGASVHKLNVIAMELNYSFETLSDGLALRDPGVDKLMLRLARSIHALEQIGNSGLADSCRDMSAFVSPRAPARDPSVVFPGGRAGGRACCEPSATTASVGPPLAGVPSTPSDNSALEDADCRGNLFVDRAPAPRSMRGFATVPISAT